MSLCFKSFSYLLGNIATASLELLILGDFNIHFETDSYPETSDFPIQNLPYGVFQPDAKAAPRCGVAIGDQVCLEIRDI